MKYTLMNQNKEIISCEVNEDTGQIEQLYDYYDLNYLPPGIVQNKMLNRDLLNKWWLSRSIPDGRKGIRNALEEMGLDSPKGLIVKGHGLSLSDQYWIQPEGTTIRWKDINYFDNEFAEYVGNVLLGKDTGHEEMDLASPCNTSSGNLSKKWVIENGKRYLIKGGSGAYLQEPFNEVLASKINERLGTHPFVEYKLVWEEDKPYSSCKNMITHDTELVSAYQVFNLDKKPNELSFIQHLINMGERIGIKGMQDSLDYMMTIDYIIGNVDRHYNNFGFIRNVQTLQYEGFSPIYDNGNSMWFDLSTGRIDYEKDILSLPFRKVHSDQIQLVQSFDKIDLNKLKGIDEEFAILLIASPDIDQPRIEKLCEGLKYRIDSLEDIKEKSIKKILYVAHEDDIKMTLKKAGYKATPTLLNNIRKLNELQGKDNSVVDIKEQHKNISEMNGKEKYLLKAIVDEFKLQHSKGQELEL